MATRSGLIRWEEYPEKDEFEDDYYEFDTTRWKRYEYDYEYDETDVFDNEDDTPKWKIHRKENEELKEEDKNWR